MTFSYKINIKRGGLLPELPEVEIIKKSLEAKTKGKRIIYVEVFNGNMVQHPTKYKLENEIIGRSIESIDRRGKYLILKLSGEKYLVLHLRMTGQLVVRTQRENNKYLRARFKLSGDLYMDFIDKRKFATMAFLSKKELHEWKSISELGPEPLTKEFTYGYFKKSLLKSRRTIKNLLLDQKTIAGLGNIYADEALFRGKINPSKCARNLSTSEITSLFFSIKVVLNEGIKFSGTSFSDYVDANGESGSYQDKLNVYQQEGKSCVCCGDKIKRIKLSGRSTFFCPNCQPDQNE